MEALFGRFEAAALLAVERANGGELAPLEQVIMSFEALFGQSVTAATFAESVALLVDAGLVEWANRGLELTLDGRRVIRRSGSHWDAELPDKVAERLSRIEEDELAPEGELPSPTEEEVLGALQALNRGRLEGDAPLPGDAIAPSGMAGHQTIGARLLSGLPGGYALRVAVPGMTAAPAPPADQQFPTVPLVSPADSESAGAESPDEAGEQPEQPGA
jgi:hypothetical protein